MKVVRRNIRPGDLLLRRYDSYLDGLVFSQNSYFTHVGIFYGEHDKRQEQVLHATGENGVHPEDLEDYCKCDDLVILRFTLDYTEEEELISMYIKEERRGNNVITDAEAKIFDRLILNVKKNKIILKYCNDIILQRAKSLLKTSYDYSFNFREFTRLSCIEYVWYCYKCLFPLHRIKVIDFEYFGWIKMPVIVPDVFIKNDYFELVYSSLPKVGSKELLQRFINSDRSQIAWFVFNIFIWDAVILYGLYFFDKYVHDIF